MRLFVLGLLALTGVLLLSACEAPSPERFASPTAAATPSKETTPITRGITGTTPAATTNSLIATLTAITVLPSATPMAGTGKVDVGGHKLFIHCTGEKSPTIVLEAGLGASTYEWGSVLLPRLATTTRACAYDRAGLGRSDPGPKPTTSEAMAKELHTLLAAAQIPRPYVLVGWSLGGLNVRVYAGQYPEDVAGMVLLDSSHPDQVERALALMPPETAGESTGLQEERKLLARSVLEPEGVDWEASAAQARAVRSLGDIPLVVITASPDRKYAGDYGRPDLPEELSAKLQQEWQALQRDLLRLSTNSTQIIAEKSGHCIHCSQPSLVIEAIDRVVLQARER